jgi:glyoxylase-like metal-dependent hydrolase (beta-lactamase superfamily II)
LYERLARFDIAEDQTLTRQLRSLGYEPTDVDIALVSHLHQDHIGGLGELPNAEIVVTRDEWATMGGLLPEMNGILRGHLDFPPERWRTVEFEPISGIAGFERGFDVFGDGTLTLLSTPGHTPGSMSLLVRDPGFDPALLVGDVTYNADAMLTEGTIPGVGVRSQLAETTRRIQTLARATPELRILAAHDPATTAAQGPPSGAGE